MNLQLNYEGFEANLVKKELLLDGVHYVFKFENRYGASIIKHSGSYGSRKDLWELAVIKFENDEDWDICYDTPITSDVIGWQKDEEIRNLLEHIKAL